MFNKNLYGGCFQRASFRISNWLLFCFSFNNLFFLLSFCLICYFLLLISVVSCCSSCCWYPTLIPLPGLYTHILAAINVDWYQLTAKLLGIVLAQWERPSQEMPEVMLSPWECPQLLTGRVGQLCGAAYTPELPTLRLDFSWAHVSASPLAAHAIWKPPVPTDAGNPAAHPHCQFWWSASLPTLPKAVYCLPSNFRPFCILRLRRTGFSWSTFCLCLLEILGWKIL